MGKFRGKIGDFGELLGGKLGFWGKFREKIWNFGKIFVKIGILEILKEKWGILGLKLRFVGEDGNFVKKNGNFGQNWEFLEDFWVKCGFLEENLGNNWGFWEKLWKDWDFWGFCIWEAKITSSSSLPISDALVASWFHFGASVGGNFSGKEQTDTHHLHEFMPKAEVRISRSCSPQSLECLTGSHCSAPKHK